MAVWYVREGDGWLPSIVRSHHFDGVVVYIASRHGALQRVAANTRLVGRSRRLKSFKEGKHEDIW